MSVLPVGIGSEEAAGGYQIERSLRFNSADSAYLSKTFGSAGNRKTWTWSGWIKKTQVTTARLDVFCGGSGTSDTTFFEIQFGSTTDESIRIVGYNTIFLKTTQVFRDPSSWFHLVCAFDSTQATASNRIKLYVNGSLITAYDTDNRASITQNGDFGVNQAAIHAIGANTAPGFYFNGYLTDINFIDGSALDPTSFGEFNATTGVWQPKAYTGSYGTNGFYLNFSDNSGTTSTTLGKDSSGNGNNWTPNLFSVTAGADNDSLVDTPTSYGTDTGAGGEVRGNYCTLNPLANTGIGTLSNGNLTLVTSTNNKTITATMGIPPSGQWYFEITATDYVTDGGTYIGVVNTPFLTSFPANDTWLGILTYNASYNNGTAGDTNNLSQANATQDGDIYCFAIDATNGKFWMGRSRSGTLVWADGVTPSVNGSGATTLALPSGTLYPMAWRGGSYNETYDFNFGQRAFAHAAPSGFKALCTQNLPEPTIADGGQYFNTVLYTGTGADRSVTGVGFQPDFLWIKNRGDASSHGLQNAVTGANKQMRSNSTAAESTLTENVTSFDADGFSLGDNSDGVSVNENTKSYVAWNWKANGSGVSNTDGTITSTVSANTDSGFSIVKYNTSGTVVTVGHGLTRKPDFIIVKETAGGNDWFVYNSARGALYNLRLNSTAAEANQNSVWNSTEPTSSVFTSGTFFNSSNVIAYCFAAIPGYSAFGSYTGNGSADGPFVYTGFRPAFVMWKITSTTGNWRIADSARNPFNVVSANLEANLTDAEGATSNTVDFLSNGFKIRGTGNDLNTSSGAIIYMTFAESPFKYSLAR